MVGTEALLSAQTTAWWCIAGEEGPREAAESTLQGWVPGVEAGTQLLSC